MTPVVNPVWFYLMGLSTPVRGLFFTIAGVCLILAILYVATGEDEEDKRKITKGKKFFILTIIFGLFVAFIPTEDTITKMLIAQNVTYERIEVATDTVENVYQDIMGLFDKTDNDD